MNAFLISDVLKHRDCELVVRRLGKLHVQLSRFELRSGREPVARMSSSSVSFLLFANPENGDPNTGIKILFFKVALCFHETKVLISA
jgi:hypothetical protein